MYSKKNDFKKSFQLFFQSSENNDKTKVKEIKKATK